MEAIKIENLTFTYPSKEIHSLHDVSLTINQGEFVTICGKSGCGKSTLLRQLKPAIAPHGIKNGRVYFYGREISKLTHREQAEFIGFVGQNPDNQIVCDKVWHEMAFGLENLSCPNQEIRARVAEMASFFGIQSWFYKNVSELSGGQKQLLNLASVMVMQPSVLMLDEPTSQLDPIAAHDFLETLSRINKELGTTIVLTEHRLEEAFPISDRIIVMENGHIIADGIPQEVGNVLHESGNDMFEALPTPMRVYYSVLNDEKCPVTVRDGREWLSKMQVTECKATEEQKNAGDAVLEMKDIFFRYEKEQPDVIKGLSVKISEDEFYAIVGGNGAGKTTALSLMMGIAKPYRGKVKISGGKTIAALPQNPQSLFVSKTVLGDLREIADDHAKDEAEKKIRNVIEFCELYDLLDSHPYDLSGGEQQRAALAKVLLKEPDILILDEPTKGLDAHFKEKLAEILKALQKSGVTIIMVSHDIEFCAKYADRLGMFFDGKIVSEDTPKKFFMGKSFYTTAANRMARSVLPYAVLDEDIIEAIGGSTHKFEEEKSMKSLYKKSKSTEKAGRKIKKPSAMNIIMGIVFLALFGLVQYFFCGKMENWKESAAQIGSLVLFAAAVWNLVPRMNFAEGSIQVEKSKRKLSRRTIVAAVMILLMIPLTIFVGMYYLDDRKYYFISSLIILETLLPFALVFENRKPQAREIVTISVLCAIAVVGRLAFTALPQFKPTLAVVIISGIAFGGEAGFLVGAVSAFVSNFFFGQGAWTAWQMFSFGIVGFVSGVLFAKGLLRKNKVELCIFGFFATLVLYGGIMNPSSVILWQEKPTMEMFLSSYVMGLPFDLIHAVSTLLFLWFAAEPMCEKIERIKQKYGLI